MAHTVPLPRLEALARCTETIRNVAILAHVDHGKTTLTDQLVASNGIISSKAAGTLRYMDSLPEEQRRGITMKASAISLIYGSKSTEAKKIPHLIHLLDSPGHVDFNADVSTVTRLADGAVIVVDAVEGVSPQTHSVMQLAWHEGLKPILFINKLDRLITELGLPPAEAAHRLRQIIEAANVVAAALLTAGAFSRADDGAIDLDSAEASEKALFFSYEKGNVLLGSALHGWGFTVPHIAERLADLLQLPKSVLRKALAGDFAFQAKKADAETEPSARARAGIVPLHKAGTRAQTMFAEYALQPIWRMYQAGMMRPNLDKLRGLVERLGLHEVALKEDGLGAVKAVTAAWCPLAGNLLDAVVRLVPSPAQSQAARLDALLPARSADAEDGALPAAAAEQLAQSRAAIAACSIEATAPVIVGIVKTFAVDAGEVPAPAGSPTRCEPLPEQVAAVQETLACEELPTSQTTFSAPHGQSLVCLARVLSGTLRPGVPLFAASPRWNPAHPVQNTLSFIGTSPAVYMPMAKDLFPLAEAPAGMIVALMGLDHHVVKAATLSSLPLSPPLMAPPSQARALVTVSLRPERVTDLAALRQGLLVLNAAEPAAQVSQARTGELTLSAVGELHLQRCVDDLEQKYARVPLVVSPPIVAFRETLCAWQGGLPADDSLGMTGAVGSVLSSDPAIAAAVAKSGSPWVSPSVCDAVTAYAGLTSAAEALGAGASALRVVQEDSSDSELSGADDVAGSEAAGAAGGEAAGHNWADSVPPMLAHVREPTVLCSVEGQLLWLHSQAAPVPGTAGAGAAESLGPIAATSVVTPAEHAALAAAAAQRACPGLKILQTLVQGPQEAPCTLLLGTTDDDAPGPAWAKACQTLQLSFREAVGRGALCAEPVCGTVLTVRPVSSSVVPEPGAHSAEPASPGSPVAMVDVHAAVAAALRSGSRTASGVSTVRSLLHAAWLCAGLRLVEPVYHCTLQCSGGRGGGGEALGAMYAVLSKRRAKVLAEELLEGTEMFNISALMPVAESWGLADELRRATSGAVLNPQLAVAGWRKLTVDPFFRPTTEDEREEYGDEIYEGQLQNLAMRYIAGVRDRKGLSTADKLVVHAEKQRTRSRKK